MKKQITKQNNQFKNTINYFFIVLMFTGFASFSQSGAALNFDGSGDRVNLGTAITTSLNGSTKLTIEAWVNTTTNSGGHGPIIGNYSTNAGGAFSFLLRRENAHHVFWIGNNSTQFPLVSLNTSSLNVWTHLACVWNGTTASIYVNGVLTTSNTFTLTSLQNSNNNQVHIGAAPINSEFFNGSIDEVRIWNVARTQCQINTFKNCEIPNNTAGLLVNYHFNQGVASGSNTGVTTLTDATSSAITGTLSGITLTGTASNWVAPGGIVSGYTTALAGPSYSASSLSVCPGKTISLTSTGATSFTWSPSISNGVAFTPTASTGYTVTNINSVSSCSNTSVANVTINSLPNVSISLGLPNNPLCIGQSATLSASGTASTYTWNTGANINSIVVSPTVTTNYTLTGTGLNGCTNNAFANLVVSTCVGINELTNSANIISIYPNPSSTNLTVKTDENIQAIAIYNSSGFLVQTEKTNTFSVEQLARGLYILTIKTENKTTTARFIKE